MKRMATGLCVAAAFGCIATLGAQTSTTDGQRSPMTDKARDVTITGCLSKGADGKYMLTNAKMDTATTTAGTTTPGTATSTTTGTTTAATTAGGSAAMNHAAAMSWMLSGGSDLDKHVGHKIQVTGRSGWDDSMDHSRTPDTTMSRRPPRSYRGGRRPVKDMRADQPQLDVQSIKMVASICS